MLTKYFVQRTCFMNLGPLMAGSLYTTVFDWKEGKYMAYVSGYVPRKEVLEMESRVGLRSALRAIRGAYADLPRAAKEASSCRLR